MNKIPDQPIFLAKNIGPSIIAKGTIQEYSAQITIFSASGCDEGAYYPSQDINVYGTKALEALRDFCIEVLKSQQDLKEILHPPKTTTLGV